MQNQYVTNLVAPDAHPDHPSLPSDAQAEKARNPRKRKLRKSRQMKTKTECHDIEPNPSKDRVMPEEDRFEMNL
jgi:hypothetical protein